MEAAFDQRSRAAGRPTPEDLASLIGPALAGNRAAMRDLLSAVAPTVARAARRILGRGHPDVDDVAQQALAGFVEALPKFRRQSSVVHFAERIAVYRALSARRDAGVRERLIEVVGDPERASASIPPSAGAGLTRSDEMRGALVQALRLIPAPQAEALALHFFFDYTVPEIAALTEVPEETVRSRLRRGKLALRHELERRGAFPGDGKEAP